MHATYAFLLDSKKITRKNWADWAGTEFECHYVQPYCEEDNYYQLQALVLSDGRFVPLCPLDDVRGRDRIQKDLANTAAESRWSWTLQFSVGLVAVALGLFSETLCGSSGNTQERIDGMSYNDLLDAINDEVPRVLAKSYASIPSSPRTCIESEYWDTDWMRSRRAEVFEMFRSSYLRRLPPFALPRSPYARYRAYDLTEHLSDRTAHELAILLVDIHT